MNRAPEMLNPTLLNNKNEFGKYGPTLLAVLKAVASAAFFPAVLFYLGWLQNPPFDRQTLIGAVGHSLILSVVPLLFPVLILSNSIAKDGLAERFLRWSPNVCTAISRTTHVIAWFCIPLIWLYSALETFDGGRLNDSLGRFAFILSMGIFAVGLCQTNVLIRKYCASCTHQNNEEGLGFWTRLLLSTICVLPVVMILLSATGYHFTAIQLSWRMFWTLVVITGIALTTSLTSRMLLIMQYRMKLQQFQNGGNTTDESSLDISEITAQVNRLLRALALVTVVVFAWQIWSNVIPAVAYLEQFNLWQTSAFSMDGTTSYVTLREALMSAGLLAITFVLSRNLPGILEIVLLDRLPLDRGGRYAISFICRYVVGISGIMLTFRWLGFSWTTVQWLAAGLTVGLGFGLQEIFANLVSGLIILIERPVRVGDFVTVNGVDGHILRVQLRATTIKDLDHRELIVPNKKFITEDVINWTLSDRSTRVIIQVGIAYGSDTKKAQKVLLDVARRNPLVKNIPHPEVVFLSFGESTLDFELRVMIATREVYYQVIHELNMEVDAAFRENDIEIAFPQRDVHLHGLPYGAQPNGDKRQKILPPVSTDNTVSADSRVA